MRLSKRDKYAIINSAKHWINDIIIPLLHGEKILHDSITILPVWESTMNHELQKVVPCFQSDCPLCEEYCEKSSDGTDCSQCPYFRYYKIQCFHLHWKKWYENIDVNSAIEMAKSLLDILKESEV